LGQKSHPYGVRLGYIKPWRAKWYSRRNVSELLHEDLKIRDYVKEKLAFAGVANVEIERSGGRVRVRIYTARPGVIIGRRGQEIDKLRDELGALTKGELLVDIKEVKNPQIDAQLIAENVAMQLEKRIGFRRAMKKAIQVAMTKGALGIKMRCKGRLGGAEIARTEKYHEGSVPLGTFRADVDYGFTEAHTTYGSIGIKVWVYKGDILVKREEAKQKEENEKRQAEMLKKEGLTDQAEDEDKSPKRSKKAKKSQVEESSSGDRLAEAETSTDSEEKPSETGHLPAEAENQDSKEVQGDHQEGEEK